MTAPGSASGPSLLQDAQALTRHRGPSCSIGKLLETPIGPELQEALNSEVHATAVAAALKQRGHHATGETVQRHRRRDCSCRS